MTSVTEEASIRPPTAPTGLGLYIRAMSADSIPRRIKHMADHGLTWAAIGCVWQDIDKNTEKPVLRTINSPDRCHRIVEEMLNHNMAPHLWGYPWRNREEQFAELMERSSTPDVDGWLIDPELGMKDEDDDAALAAAAALFWQCIEANPYRVIGFTSYGHPKFHPTFPWGGFAVRGGFDPLHECDYGSPQLYDKPHAVIKQQLAAYRDLGVDVLVPSYGTYRFSRTPSGQRTYPRMTYGELKAHLQAFADLKDEFDIHAMIGWSESQVSSGGWRALAESAEVFV